MPAIYVIALTLYTAYGVFLIAKLAGKRSNQFSLVGTSPKFNKGLLLVVGYIALLGLIFANDVGHLFARHAWFFPADNGGSGSVAYAQNSGDTTSSMLPGWPPQFYLVLMFFLLGFIVLAMQFVLFLRSSEKISANYIMRSFSTTVILISVVALAGAGYNQQEVQPTYVIGTLLGYLMGRGTLTGDSPPSSARHRPSDLSDNADDR